MKCITIPQQQRKKLMENAHRQDAVRGTDQELDLEPVAKLYVPNHPAIWLLTELNSYAPHIGYGLCDFGVGYPEFGPIDLTLLVALASKGLEVQCDPDFKATKTIGKYGAEAQRVGRIIA